MSREGPTAELLQSPLLFSADDRPVDSVPADRSKTFFPASNFPYTSVDSGAGPRLKLEPSEVIYNHSHLLERPTKLPSPQQPRVGIIQSFQIKPESPLSAKQPLSPVQIGRKITADEPNGAGAKTVTPLTLILQQNPKGEPGSPAGLSTASVPLPQADKREQKYETSEGPFALRERPSRFEDIETSSILSIEQLTETLNELTSPNVVRENGKLVSSNSQQAQGTSPQRELVSRASHSSADDDTTADTRSVASSLNHSLSFIPPNPPIQQLPPLPSHIQPGKAIGTAPSSPTSSHAWQGFHFSRNSDTFFPPGVDASLAAPKQREDLEEQLHNALKSKAHLEGQLESVIGECKTLLQDRAELQSKVARVEVALKEAERMSQEMSKMATKSGTPLEGRDAPPRKDDLTRVSLALQKEQKLLSSVQEALEKERDAKQKLQNELLQCKKKLSSQESILKSTQEQCSVLQARLEQKSKEKEGVDGRLVAAETSLKTTEESKLWLRGRLDEALNLNTKLQSELRDAKTAALAHSIRADQLRKENEGFQNHIAALHQGMMKDKETLVGQLEAIEADVLSREEACEQLAASRLQIEEMVRGKAEEIEVLTNKLAESEMQRGELGEELSEARGAIEQITQNSVKEKNALVAKLSVAEQEMAGLQANVKALEKLNATLQERARQAEAASITKEGLAEGLKETCRTLQIELDTLKEALDAAEEKLVVAGQVNEEVESALKGALEREKVSEMRVKGLLEGQRASAGELLALKSALAEKGKEAAQRATELSALGAQSRDVMAAFQSLQERFQTISAGSEGIAQRDQTIAALNTEKAALEQQLVEVKEERNKTLAKLDQMQQEKARLLGELEVAKSSDMEEFRKAVQAKAVLESELNMAKLTHQQELAKGQKKAQRLEAELKSLKETSAEREKEYLTALQEEQIKLAKITVERTHTQDELQEAREQLEQNEEAKREMELALQRAEEQVATLQEVNESVSKSNRDLVGKLQQEVAQKSEVERASSLVTLKLKQNAEENERRLQKQVADLTLELERLRGKLSGISTAQICLRDHTGALEAALATKESSLVKLSAQAQKALEEKEEEERERTSVILRLEQSVEQMKEELQRTKEKTASDKRSAAEEVGRLEQKVAELLEQHGEEAESSRIKMEQLAKARDELQMEVGELRMQVLTARTAADMTKQDLANKSSQVEVLQKELESAKAHWRQAQEETHQLREQLRLTEEQHMAQLEMARRPLIESTPIRKGPSNNDISATIGTEETDTSAMREADTSQNTTAVTVDTSSFGDISRDPLAGLFSLKEVGGRLELARKQGQEAAEQKKLSEIKALRSELGHKSRTVGSLQSCLFSLKEDMDKLQKQMEQHTVAVAASHQSSRQIESQIESLKRSSLSPSLLPTNSILSNRDRHQ